MTWESLRQSDSRLRQLEDELRRIRPSEKMHWQIWEAYKQQISLITCGNSQAYEIACHNLYNAFSESTPQSVL